MDIEFPPKPTPDEIRKWPTYLAGVWLQPKEPGQELGPLALIFHSRSYMSIVARGRTTSGKTVTYHRFETYHLDGDKIISLTVADESQGHQPQTDYWKFEDGKLWIGEKGQWSAFHPGTYRELIECGLEKSVVDYVYAMAHFSRSYPFQEKVDHLPLREAVPPGTGGASA